MSSFFPFIYIYGCCWVLCVDLLVPCYVSGVFCLYVMLCVNVLCWCCACCVVGSCRSIVMASFHDRIHHVRQPLHQVFLSCLSCEPCIAVPTRRAHAHSGECKFSGKNGHYCYESEQIRKILRKKKELQKTPLIFPRTEYSVVSSLPLEFQEKTPENGDNMDHSCEPLNNFTHKSSLPA